MPERVDYRAPIKIEAVGIGNSGRPMSYFEYVPVEPLTRVQIAATPRTERFALLQDQQLAYTRPYLEEAFRQPLSEVKPDTLRLAITIFDVQHRSWELAYDANKRDAASKTYGEEKRKIRASGKSKGDQARAVESALRTWQQQDSSLKQEADADETLRTDVIDLFIKDTLLTKDGPQNFLVATEDLVSQTAMPQDSVIKFLKEVATRFKNVKVAQDLSHLKYKDGTDNFITERGSQLLQNIVRLAFSETTTNPVKNQLGEVALGIINAYWGNVDLLYGEQELAPRLAFANDVLFAAFISGDINIIKNTVKYMWGNIEKSSGSFTRESSAINGTILDEVIALAAPLDSVLGSRSSGKTIGQLVLEAEPQVFEQFNPSDRGCFVGTNYDRRSNLHAAARFAHEIMGYRDYTNTLFSIQLAIQIPDNQKSDYVHRLFEYPDPFNKKIKTIFPGAIGLNELVQSHALKSNYDSWVSSARMQQTHLTTTDERQKFYDYNRTHPNRKSLWLIPEAQAALLTRTLFDQEGLDSLIDLEKTSRSNNRLFSRIRFSNLWFIAENSDRYSVANNPDLAQRSIRSVTFSPEPQIEGWRIGLVTDLRTDEGEEVSYNFHLNKDGTFLTDSGTSLRNALVPLWIRLPFERFILERLYFITSGVLGVRGAQKTQEGEGNQVEKRRHHWRTLRSTTDRIYTLMSSSARTHATFVRERYGYDIYRENILRRTEGGLAENECVTFVKAVVPSENAEPNEIIFNPNLLSTVN